MSPSSVEILANKLEEGIKMFRFVKAPTFAIIVPIKDIKLTLM